MIKDYLDELHVRVEEIAELKAEAVASQTEIHRLAIALEEERESKAIMQSAFEHQLQHSTAELTDLQYRCARGGGEGQRWN